MSVIMNFGRIFKPSTKEETKEVTKELEDHVDYTNDDKLAATIVGECIMKYRILNGIPAIKFAENSGISITTLNNIESGDIKTLMIDIIKIVSAYNINVNSLVDVTGQGLSVVDVYPSSATKLKELRKKAGDTQKTVSSATSIPARVISSYETGSKPCPFAHAVTLAKYYNVDIIDLY